MSTQISDANSLVTYVKAFTGSSNDTEIKQCIFLAEFTMRNLELPSLRTDPWTTIGYAGPNGYLPIPADMLKPILFFQQGNQSTTPGSYVGPWIVYDRIGDRDMITQLLVQNLYLNPVNIPQVYRGNFSEIGQNYAFTPKVGEGTAINMYYYKTWPLLFSDDTNGDPILNNVILQSWPEGYVYGTLREYYLKRKMPEDAAVWASKCDNAYNILMDQYNKGKWSGGHNKLWSVFQPRQIRRFSTK